MQQTIDIPDPSGADTDTVITALETAAVFHAKGDGREAMRWLRRAAEYAGDAGDDERALALSRIAADLQTQLDAPQARAATPPPPPPPLPPPSARPSRPLPSTHTNGVSAEASTAQANPETTAPSVAEPVRLSTPPSSRAESVTASTAVAGTGARHAARVAVSISTSKVGVFELRLLADGEAPRLGSSEGFLVMLDPASTLLAR